MAILILLKIIVNYQPSVRPTKYNLKKQMNDFLSISLEWNSNLQEFINTCL